MDAADDSWRHLLFDDLFRGIRLQSSVYFRPQFGAPWGIMVAAHGTVFPIVSHGRCVVQLNSYT